MSFRRIVLLLSGLACVAFHVSAQAGPARTSQTISFGSAPTLVVGGTGTVSATATSTLAVTFTSTTKSVCTVKDSTVTGVSAGKCTIAANQAGNGSFTPAVQVTQDITVGKGSQTISFGANPTVLVGGTGKLTATSTAGLAVTLASTTKSICTVKDATITGVVIGTCTITADQAGNTNYTSATQVSASFAIAGKVQTLKFGTAPTVVVGGTGKLVASGGGSTNAVVLTSTTTDICTVSGTTVTGLSVGSCVVAANQAGTTTYAAATQVTQSITVGKGTQTIAFGAAPILNAGSTGTVSATGGASGNAVTFASTTTSVCTINGTTVTGVTSGKCTIAANQTGSSNYNAAKPVTQDITVGKTTQTISFTAPALTVGVTATLSATATSGLTVTITSAAKSVCTVSGSQVTAFAAGTCTLNANQAGNGSYAAANQVAQSTTVGKGSQTITLGTLSSLAAGGSAKLTATASSGLTVSLTSTTKSVCTVKDLTVTGVTSGSCTITADQAGNANYTAATQASTTFTVAGKAQSIKFGVAPTLVVGGTGKLAATPGASGNAVVFSSNTPSFCTVTGTTVTGVAAGSCVVAANQPGNNVYGDAPPVTQNITVGKGTQTIVFGAAPTMMAGGTGTVSASGGASGNTVTFTSTTTSVCTIDGTTVTDVTAGKCTIAANQAGNSNYNAAAQVTQDITVGKTAQTIVFGPAPTVAVGGTGTVSAMGGGSGSPVVFSVVAASNAICSVSGATVTGKAVGTCVIAANQAGNASYSAAAQVTQNVTVSNNITLTVTPSLGQFTSSMATVKILSAGGQLITQTTCCTSGAATVATPTGYVGSPVIVVVSGGSYFDEATQQILMQTTPLIAVVSALPSASSSVAVNPLTTAAAAAVGVTAQSLDMVSQGLSYFSFTPTAILQANATVADLMGLEGTDIISVIPTPIGSAVATGCSNCQIVGSTQSDQVAAVLAVFSLVAKNNGVTPDVLTGMLAGAITFTPGVSPVGALIPDAVNGDKGINQAAASISNTGLIATGSTVLSQLAGAEVALTTAQQTVINGLKAGAAPSAVVQAKSFFSALRTGIMPYVVSPEDGSSSSGFLDKQSAALHTDANALSKAVDYVGKTVKIAKLGQQLMSMSGQSSLPGDCQQLTQQLYQYLGSNNQAACYFDNGNDVVLMTKLSSTRGTWQVVHFNPGALYGGNGSVLTPIYNDPSCTTNCNLSHSMGSVDFSNDGSTLTMTLNGWFNPQMSAGNVFKVGQGNIINSTPTINAATGATCTNSDIPFVVTVPASVSNGTLETVTLKGEIKNMLPDSTTGLATCSGRAPAAKLLLGTATCTSSSCSISAPASFTWRQVGSSGFDGIPNSASLAATVFTPNYVFNGQITANKVTTITVSNKTEVNGASISFTGTVNGSGKLSYHNTHDNAVSMDTDTTNNFQILSGSLTASINGTSNGMNYNPTRPDSASNNQVGTLSFTGQVFKSASDPGLKLTIGDSHTWNTTANGYVNAISLGYYDKNQNLAVTGSTNLKDHESPTTKVSLVLSCGNGVTVNWTRGVAATPVLVGTTIVGTIDGNRVSFTDGTFQSLF